jgi:hypothetical protein
MCKNRLPDATRFFNRSQLGRGFAQVSRHALTKGPPQSYRSRGHAVGWNTRPVTEVNEERTKKKMANKLDRRFRPNRHCRGMQERAAKALDGKDVVHGGFSG